MEPARISLSWRGILLLALLCGRSSAQETVRGLVGRDVTLTCRYDARYYGTLAVCWGRGAIPRIGCGGQEVIRSDGAAVISRESERYALRGDLTQGDVSLTIRQLREDDAGTYGCRVDIPGWFNDHKHHTVLVVQPGPPDAARLELRERRSRMVLLRWTAGFDGGSPLTGYSLEYKDMAASWGSAAVLTLSVSPQLSRATVTDLQPFSTYNIRLFSRNAVGASPASNTLTVTTKEEAPGGPPLDVEVEALSSDSLEVSWRPPRIDLHYGVIKRYIVAFRRFYNHTTVPWTTATVLSTGRRQHLVLANLSPATQYAVGVQAVSGEGGGPVSPPLVCSTLDDEHTTSTSYIITESASTDVAHGDTKSTVSEMVTDSAEQQDVWHPTESPEGLEEVSSLSTMSPQSTTFSNQIEAIKSGDEEEEAESHNLRLVGIVIPVVLVALVVVMAILWQLKRLKEKNTNLEISWKNNGSLAFSDTQLLPEL